MSSRGELLEREGDKAREREGEEGEREDRAEEIEGDEDEEGATERGVAWRK